MNGLGFSFIKLTTIIFLFMIFQNVCGQGCRDRENYWTCYNWYHFGYCDTPRYHRGMVRLCAYTCGFCHLVPKVVTTAAPSTAAPTTLPPTTVAPTTLAPTTLAPTTLAPTTAKSTTVSPDRCKDTNNYCFRYKRDGYCNQGSVYFEFMRKRCAKTCGFCIGVCKDEKESCPRWRQFCVRTGEYWGYMRKNCPKTCKICVDDEGKTAGKTKDDKKFECNFEKNFCQWKNEHHDDLVNWVVGIDPDGPEKGPDGSGQYAFLNTRITNYRGRLTLPWLLVMSLNETKKSTLCLRFQYNMVSGSLKIYEQEMPSVNNYQPKPVKLLSLEKGTSNSWQEAKVSITYDSLHMLYMEAFKTRDGSHIAVDNAEFFAGSC